MDAVTLLPIVVVALAVVGVVTAGTAIFSVARSGSRGADKFGSIAYGASEAARRQSGEKLSKRDARQRRARMRLVLDISADNAEIEKRRQVNTYESLEKKLRYAGWNISPLTFRIIQLAVTVLVFIPCYLHLTIFLQGIALLLTPLLVRDVLYLAIQRRFKAFDRDYPVLLMQFVSFFKTGMVYLTALQEAAKALPEGSIVRSEVEVLVERLRLGLSEELAVGAFGEDIAHPEIELFVQTLLLHGKIGGKITPTLERLARQVRKRQQFRKEAVAAVAMERMSVYAISAVMIFVLLYIFFNSPPLILSAFTTSLGIHMFQGGLAAILFGFYWSKQVTKIKV